MSSAMGEQGQMALSLTLPDMAELDNYVPGDNHVAYQQVRHIAQGLGEFCVYLWGGDTVGKSHLLQGACQMATFNRMRAIYLPLKEHEHYSVTDLEGLERLDLVCLDDVDKVAGTEWEEAIFHLYNRLRAKDKHILISGDKPPGTIDIQLPDLRTRLGWGTVYHLVSLTDEDKRLALINKARLKGLDLPEDVARFILLRAPRSMGELFKALDTLDKASLTYQRKLTIPFVKQVLHY